MQKLSQARQQDEAGRQQIALAQQKFDAGSGAVQPEKVRRGDPAARTVVPLNPSSDATANYLKLAQQEDERVKAGARRTRGANDYATASDADRRTDDRGSTVARSRPPALAAGADGQRPGLDLPFFDSTGRRRVLVVKVGADEVARENLWYERRIIPHPRAAAGERDQGVSSQECRPRFLGGHPVAQSQRARIDPRAEIRSRREPQARADLRSRAARRSTTSSIDCRINFAIASRDELWLRGALVQSRLMHGEARQDAKTSRPPTRAMSISSAHATQRSMLLARLSPRLFDARVRAVVRRRVKTASKHSRPRSPLRSMEWRS